VGGAIPEGSALSKCNLAFMGYDCHVVDEAGKELPDAENRYLRRNIFSMGPLRDELERLEMGFYSNVPPWPKPPCTEEEMAKWLRATFNESPGIALHKCCSNDGYIVTALECKTALAIWERAGSPMPEVFYDDFIPFLREAAANGGFGVY